jgi:disease resistance protein RPS2
VLVFSLLDNLTIIKMCEGTSSSQAVFPRLTHLTVNSCSKLQHLSRVQYLPCLEHLHVSGCHAMKQICLDAGQESSKTFPCLRYLVLCDNHELASLCGSDVTFPCLESLIISLCPKLKRLPFTMQSLPHKSTKLVIGADCWNELEWEDEGVKSFLERRVLVFNY